MSHAIDVAPRHTLLEDGLSLVIASVMIAFGLLLLQSVGTLTGGAAGVALLVHYYWDLPVGWAYFLINAPFFLFAVRQMGWSFSIKTLIAVCLISLISNLQGRLVGIGHLQPVYATLVGNIMMGLGLLALFRHKASAGGVSILAAYCQNRFGLRAGWVQLGVDVLVLIASLSVVNATMLLISVLGAALFNAIVAINHRPGRYFG